MKQVGLRFRTWGGARKGAGRKRVAARGRVLHRTRPVLQARFPVHVTWRMRVSGLRTRRCFRALARAFRGGADRFGFRLVHYSVQGNHVHLLVEAESERSLSRGMNGLAVRVAKGINRVLGRSGKVLEDRYHGHILRTPTEVRHARNYLLQNAGRHVGLRGVDPFASRVAVMAPRTFVMRRVC
jgi:REP element-mobilizing transposase RayT